MRRSFRHVGQRGQAGSKLLFLLALLAAFPAFAQQEYAAKGLVLAVDRSHLRMTVSCESIAGYMDAMIMPIEVRDARELEGLARGTMIEFSLVADKERPYGENVRIRNFDSLELDPLSARRLRLLDGAMDQSLSPDRVLKIGQPAPDFSLIDQNRGRGDRGFSRIARHGCCRSSRGPRCRHAGARWNHLPRSSPGDGATRRRGPCLVDGSGRGQPDPRSRKPHRETRRRLDSVRSWAHHRLNWPAQPRARPYWVWRRFWAAATRASWVSSPSRSATALSSCVLATPSPRHHSW